MKAGKANSTQKRENNRRSPDDREIVDYFHERLKPLGVQREMLKSLQESVNVTMDPRKAESYARYHNGEIGGYTWEGPVTVRLRFQDLTDDRQTKLKAMEFGDKPRKYVYKDQARFQYHRERARSGAKDTTPVILQKHGSKYHNLEGHHRIMGRFYDLPKNESGEPIGEIEVLAWVGTPTSNPIKLDEAKSVSKS